jgi:hypothetical protein
MTTRARKFGSLMRKRAQEVGQAPVAQAVGVDVSVVSRMFSEGRVDQFCAVIEALGLKLVPAEFRCVRSADELEHLMWLAKRGMESMKNAADLFEDDE